ncbi:hypothetical protein [Pseudoxanthomonas sp. Root630]|uniref:hypothetical protein n=1 Tax=Pseudoxanthomonas sp. Root630 TaxID=1736574 RepID=UPI000703B677|nr:hypothetical protein [Pseudoxanthomonas sp. Root630]KRA45019.1 hypothetical protein ASD72_07055 [Pseudoxanthomonas sp. Root630]
MTSETIPLDERELVATLSACSEKLLPAPDASIVEAPEVLFAFTELVLALRASLEDDVLIGNVRIAKGAYLVDIYSAEKLGSMQSSLEPLLEQLGTGVVSLELNAERSRPLSAADCGVAKGMLAILEASKDLAAAGAIVEVDHASGAAQTLPAPTPRAISALPVLKDRQSRKVDGEVTGLGRGDARGCEVQIDGGRYFIVRNLMLEDAWSWVKARTKLTGKADWDNGQWVVGTYQMHEQQALIY